MIKLVLRILRLSGERAKKMKAAFVCSFLAMFFEMLPMTALALILIKYFDSDQQGSLNSQTLLSCIVIMFISLVGRFVFSWLVNSLMRASGFEFIAEERLEIGNLIKSFPMGVFSDGSLGRITSIVTSDLGFVEMNAMKVVDQVIVSYAATIVIFIIMIIFDWRLGLIAASVLLPAFLVLKLIQKISRNQAHNRQASHEKLASAVLEYTQGMSVIKAYNMSGEKARTIENAFETMRQRSLEFEIAVIPSIVAYYAVFALGTSLVVFFAPIFEMNNMLSLPFMFLMLIMSFRLYAPAQKLGDIAAFIRIMEAALDRYEGLKQTKIIDKNCKNIQLESYGIKFENVSFAYEDENVIKDVSFEVLPNSMTALVGPSGCGKTTITNLIARFWDVQKGIVKVGDVDIKEMTCDSLLKHISIVFQRVYLFNDTIINNLRFGNPNASDEQVIQAAKKARCHDFIMKMDKEYNTVIGEGGATLSGGEKQRLSIARAILKDAPIVLLDEATSNVDPENEVHIQVALSELVKNKTLIVIAHRLSTIKSADQILVLNEGRIIEKGNHNELLNESGLYKQLWDRRQEARGWRIGSLEKDNHDN